MFLWRSEVNLRCYFIDAHFIYWGRFTYFYLEPSKLAMLAGQQATGIHLSPGPQCWDYKHAPQSLVLYIWVLGMEFRSLCLQGRYFTDYPFDARLSSWPGTHQVGETGWSVRPSLLPPLPQCATSPSFLLASGDGAQVLKLTSTFQAELPSGSHLSSSTWTFNPLQFYEWSVSFNEACFKSKEGYVTPDLCHLCLIPGVAS